MSVFVAGGTADLRAEFTVNDVLTDPVTCTLTVIAPDGTATTPAPTHAATGVYTYLLELTDPGLWRWEFVGTGSAGGARSGSLRAEPALAADTTRATDVVTLDEIETALGRALTAAEADRAEQLVANLIDVLETRLNRYLYPRTVVETRWLRSGEKLQLLRGPVRSITSLVINGTEVTDVYILNDIEGAEYVPETTIVVTYVAGDDPRPALTGLVTDVVARTIAADPTAAAGTIKSYSVEGTSIQWGDVADGGLGGSGRLKVGDIRSIGRLRRPVLLT